MTGDAVTIRKTIAALSLVSALSAAFAAPVQAQACTRQGVDVTCDDGRRGVLSGDAILWPDGTRSSSTSDSARSWMACPTAIEARLFAQDGEREKN